jgi:hypothetical protein
VLCCVLLTGRLNCLPSEKKNWEDLPNFGEDTNDIDEDDELAGQMPVSVLIVLSE